MRESTSGSISIACWKQARRAENKKMSPSSLPWRTQKAKPRKNVISLLLGLAVLQTERLFPFVGDPINETLVVIRNVERPIRAGDQACRAAQNLALLHPPCDEIFHACRLAVFEHNAHYAAGDALFARGWRRAVKRDEHSAAICRREFLACVKP